MLEPCPEQNSFALRLTVPDVLVASRAPSTRSGRERGASITRSSKCTQPGRVAQRGEGTFTHVAWAAPELHVRQVDLVERNIGKRGCAGHGSDCRDIRRRTTEFAVAERVGEVGLQRQTRRMMEANEIERALAVMAHPDDVDFGAAGTIAALTDAGVEVVYCLVTDGQAGGFDHSIPRDEMATIRRREQTEAAAKRRGDRPAVPRTHGRFGRGRSRAAPRHQRGDPRRTPAGRHHADTRSAVSIRPTARTRITSPPPRRRSPRCIRTHGTRSRSADVPSPRSRTGRSTRSGSPSAPTPTVSSTSPINSIARSKR